METDYIRKRLNDLEMSHADLARKLTLMGRPVTRQAVSHWLNGRNDMPIDEREFRLALAASLELDVNELMDRLGYIVSDDERSTEALRAAEIIDRLPDDAKTLALEYLALLDRHYIKAG